MRRELNACSGISRIDMSEENEPLHILGKISGYYGVKGWVKLYSFTEPRDNIVNYKQLKFKRNGPREQWSNITLDQGKAHGKGVIAHFVGYDNREIAAELIGAELAVHRSDFKTIDENEYYWTDLIDLRVVNLQGEQLGQVIRLMETAAHDVLVIKPNVNDANNKSAEEILIPFVLEHYIKQVDLDAGLMTVDWQSDWGQEDSE